MLQIINFIEEVRWYEMAMVNFWCCTPLFASNFLHGKHHVSNSNDREDGQEKKSLKLKLKFTKKKNKETERMSQ